MFPPYTVSIIDDDESVRLALCGLIRSMGLEAKIFSSPLEFLESEAIQSSDCIITDVHMPGMCGEIFQKHLALRANKIPLIVMTAFPSAALKKRVLSCGASCFLVKPFDENELIACLKRALAIDVKSSVIRNE